MLCIVEELGEKRRQRDDTSLVASDLRSSGPAGYQHPLASCFSCCLPAQPSFSFMDTDYVSHRIIRRIASWAVYSFFTEVRVIGGENVPLNGPIIVYVSLYHPSPRILNNIHVVPGCLDSILMALFRTATHHNMMLDPAVLCPSSRFVAIALVDVT